MNYGKLHNMYSGRSKVWCSPGFGVIKIQCSKEMTYDLQTHHVLMLEEIIITVISPFLDLKKNFLCPGVPRNYQFKMLTKGYSLFFLHKIKE